MITNNSYVRSEVEFRTGRARRAMVAGRGQRSRSSWVRRIAAAERG